MFDLDTATDAMFDTALWAETDLEGEPLDDLFTPLDFDADSAMAMADELEEFVEANIDVIQAVGLDAGQVGHDFWLTRNRHGAGFWDRGLGAAGEVLTKAAHAYGELTIYVGDDGNLHAI